jgi:hypothetical protein
MTSSAVAPLRAQAAPTRRSKVRSTPAHPEVHVLCNASGAVLMRAITPPVAPIMKTVSVRAALPKTAESARLALTAAVAVLVLTTSQPAMANSCGSMPTGACGGRGGRDRNRVALVAATPLRNGWLTRARSIPHRAACVNGVPINSMKKPTAAAAAEKKAQEEAVAQRG